MFVVSRTFIQTLLNLFDHPFQISRVGLKPILIEIGIQLHGGKTNDDSNLISCLPDFAPPCTRVATPHPQPIHLIPHNTEGLSILMLRYWRLYGEQRWNVKTSEKASAFGVSKKWAEARRGCSLFFSPSLAVSFPSRAFQNNTCYAGYTVFGTFPLPFLIFKGILTVIIQQIFSLTQDRSKLVTRRLNMPPA